MEVCYSFTQNEALQLYSLNIRMTDINFLSRNVDEVAAKS